MLTLNRARRAGGKAGEPLPSVFDSLTANGVYFRRGQLALVAAAPGVGKSAFTQKLAQKAGVPGFYFSADTDAFTMFVRGAAMETGWLMADIEKQIEAKNLEYIETKLNERHDVRYSFDPNPSLDDVEEELKAFAMTYGEWPALIVVDNLRNLFLPEEMGDNHDKACDYLHALAKKTNAAVVALHHVKGPYNDGRTPIPLPGLIGQIGKVPELILTLYKSGGEFGPSTLNVSPVKNRSGRAEADASWSLPFIYEAERMHIEG